MTKDTRANMDEVEMEMDEDGSVLQYADQSTINQTRMYNPIDMSMLPVRGSEMHSITSSDTSTSNVVSGPATTDDVSSNSSSDNSTDSNNDLSMDPLPTRSKQPISRSLVGNNNNNNITQSMMMVETSRQASQIADGVELTTTISGVMVSRRAVDATYTLVEKSINEATGHLANDDEETATGALIEQPTGTYIVSAAEKSRQLKQMNVTQTMLEKLPLPSTSYLVNKTLEISSRSFVISEAAGHQNVEASTAAALNMSSNVSILNKLNASYHTVGSGGGSGGMAAFMNQSLGIPANLPPMPTSTQQFASQQDVIGLIKSLARLNSDHNTVESATTTTNGEDELYVSIAARLDALREQSQALLARKREAAKSARARCEDENGSLRTLRQERDEWLARMEKRRDELERLRADAIKCGHKAAFVFNQAHADALQNELQEYRHKNEQIQKELDEKQRGYESLKEASENMSEMLKSLKKGQSEKEELKNMFEKMFGETHLGFRLGYYDNDTIVALFMHDLVQVEIKGTNIVKDLRNQQQQLDPTFHTYLNYPLDHVIVRSNIDPSTNLYASQYKSINEHASNLFRGSKIVPVYLKYCVELVLGEIGSGNVMLSNKKIKYVKDLSMFISHVSLASRMAANLARDFETFAFLTQDTPLKCDFEFKNHMVNLLLISMPDVCLYKLKLKVKPGCYYQQAIPFFIEKVDGEMYEPNHQRIRSLIEDQYFENGSIKSYLDRLMKL